ncbi:MAG: FAD-binding protein, partial [Gemmatimonadota bacterium]
MHGDIALCESLGSARAFLNLVELGVPFPHDRHGGFPGYRTDNDLRGRATSAGPLTSRLMCHHLGAELERLGVRVFDGHQVVALLTRGKREDGEAVATCGAVAIRKEGVNEGDFGLVAFNARNVVLATGGPGGMYRDSVYPQSQRGSLGLALRAGAVAHNLTESQFGMASVGFRWNLSGSYQQVIPRYVSEAGPGGDRREFLNAHFPDMGTLASAIFRKGYEWPFDTDRVTRHGSSLIDILVDQEIRSGRRVFLDFTRNPEGGEGWAPFTLACLEEEARDYLSRSGATGDTPVTRLAAMNEPALGLFRDNGRELAKDPLEIAVCAQHNNGGLRADIWWESNVRNLFPIGEACGTHGVRRPGGAALNAGQVGGMRAALFISRRYPQAPPELDEFAAAVTTQVEETVEFCRRSWSRSDQGDVLTPARVIGQVQDRMSRCA